MYSSFKFRRSYLSDYREIPRSKDHANPHLIDVGESAYMTITSARNLNQQKLRAQRTRVSDGKIANMRRLRIHWLVESTF